MIKLTRRVKLLVGALALALGLLAVAGAAFWYSLGAPQYQPGALSTGAGLTEPLDPPAQQGDPSYFDVAPGVRLFHFEQGKGQDLLVLHGGPGYPPQRPWRAAATLGDRYRLWFYHQRGCGKSTRPFQRSPATDYSAFSRIHAALGLPTQLADIERLRRILRKEKLVLVGHSFGGLLAALYASEFPDRVRALVLVAPAPLAVMPQEGLDLYQAVRSRLPPAKQTEFDAYLKELFDFGSLRDKTEEELASRQLGFLPFYALAAGVDPEQARASMTDVGGFMPYAIYMSMGKRHDWRKALLRATAPTLVLQGDADLQTVDQARSFAKLLPNARLVVLPGASHFPFDDKPEEFARIVSDFLAEH